MARKEVKECEPFKFTKKHRRLYAKSRRFDSFSVDPPHFWPYNTFKTSSPGNPPKSAKIRIKNYSDLKRLQKGHKRTEILLLHFLRLPPYYFLIHCTLGPQKHFVLLRRSWLRGKNLKQIFSNRDMVLPNWRLVFTLYTKLRRIIVGLVGGHS